MSARVAAGVLLAIACAAAAAQEDAVTVSATRLERPTLEVPASVDRVDAEAIRWARPQVNLSESLARVPGLSIQNRYNYAQDLQMTSRGFGARSTFGIRGLRLVADGIPASFPDGQGQVSHFDLGSAERIEVLRGPFSAMHGNAAGGVVQIFTERGSPGVSAELLAGGFDTLREALKLGGETWVVSASAFSHRRLARAQRRRARAPQRAERRFRPAPRRALRSSPTRSRAPKRRTRWASRARKCRPIRAR
ncbi:MAG: TonB-dependent receptor plug domain-containing protein [Burkholderiales bacterium]|nr:TonB-dependent receptor plug domain-containing protein [Burkholderiales bacterium]